jgi:multidrug efflux pump
MARFFIDRPVLGVVISAVILLAGLAAMKTLPIAQYPEITPPTVQVSCTYPGASAKVVRDTVAAPIEQQVNGVEHMLYMSSQSTNDGGYNLTVTFQLGTNLDMAQVLVQNRVALAMPQLPDAVKATGVSTKKKSPSILLVVNFTSGEDPKTHKPLFDQLALSNFATIKIRDDLARLDGVGDVAYMGQQDYSMRVWLDPEKLSARNLTSGDIVNALKEQNVQVAAGQIGQQPVPAGQDFQYTLSTLGRLADPQEFEQIVVKAGPTGQVVRLKDVSQIQLGAKNQDTRCTLDGKPSIGLVIYQLPGSNAIDTAKNIREKMKELEAARFPQGMHYDIVYDTTPFIQESVAEVFHALRDAVILVAVVVLLFLQDWKAMILPMIDVPVSLVGTFAVMYLMGFTLNNLTLFGLVLAIGIVVDDAIVVLEAVETKLAQGLDARTATIQAMGEITGAIIAITLVLCSVFLPSALIGGISGQFYRQFALTIAASMVISAINAMTMTPSRAVLIFQNAHHGGEGHEDTREALPWWGYAALLGWGGADLLWNRAFPALGWHTDGNAAWKGWLFWLALWIPGAIVGSLIAKTVNRILSRFFKWFNRGFDTVAQAYGHVVGGSLRVSVIVLLIYGGLLGLTYFGMTHIPTGFIPAQDKGYLIVDVQLPDSASLERTIACLKRVEEKAGASKGVVHTIGIPGQSFVLNAVGSNLASMFIILDEFDHRHDHSLSAAEIGRKLQKEFYADIIEAQVAVFGAPAVDGLGNAGGFKLMVEDLEDLPLDTLQGQSENVADKGSRLPGIAGLFSSFRANAPQLYIDIDRTKCKTLNVSLNDVFNTLQVYLGGYYVNDFNQFGRTWQVNLQADAPFRLKAEDVRQLKVRNASNDMARR